jgi:RES domain-containing protein
VLPDAELRAILPRLPRITVPSPHGSWSRTVGAHLLLGPPRGAPEGSPPQPLWPGGAANIGARFTPRGGFGTIYLASDEQTALLEAESIFLSSRGSVHPGLRQPQTLLPVTGFLPDFLDLTDPATQRELETSLSELTGHWRVIQDTGGTPPTQLLAQAAYDAGSIAGLYYVSAKNPVAGRGIAVFVDRLIPGRHLLEVIDPNRVFNQRLP